MNWFKRKTNYPKQELSDKQKELLDAIDSKLMELPYKSYDYMNVKTFKVGIWEQLSSTESIMSRFISAYLPTNCSYLPRSIALIVDCDGTWSFYIAIRTDSPIDELSTELFVDALSRTNQARVV
jgi:hypothetical protein